MHTTVQVVGQAIKNAAEYAPIRNHAAAVATLAPPKDYLAQLNLIYDDFLRRWRYVRDPAHKEMVTYTPEAVWRYVLAGDGVGVGLGKGAGDCDCATVAIGAELLSTGFPVRLCTTASPRDQFGQLYSHIFPQAFIQNLGWITVDPVLHPRQGFGALAPHSRIAYWDLDGHLLKKSNKMMGEDGGNSMLHGQSEYEYPSLNSYMGFGEVDLDGEPDDWETVGLEGWGCYSGYMGIINAPPIEVEVDDIPDAYGNPTGIARTPMIEVAPHDMQYMQIYGRPYQGMLGLGDDGTVYKYESNSGMLGGFFRKLFHKVGRGIRKVGKRIAGGLKKVIRKLPGGKLILKFAGKIHKVAMKLVRPLIKFVGKYASKLAPVAALIPGFGPAVAAGLYTAGKVANLMKSHGIELAGKKGKTRTLVSKDPRDMKRFQAELKREAEDYQQEGGGRRPPKHRRRRPSRRPGPPPGQRADLRQAAREQHAGRRMLHGLGLI